MYGRMSHNHNGLGTLVLVELALWGGDILRHRGYALYFLGLHGSSLENQKKSLGAPLSLLVSQPCGQLLPGSGKFSLLYHLQSKERVETSLKF